MRRRPALARKGRGRRAGSSPDFEALSGRDLALPPWLPSPLWDLEPAASLSLTRARIGGTLHDGNGTSSIRSRPSTASRHSHRRTPTCGPFSTAADQSDDAQVTEKHDPGRCSRTATCARRWHPLHSRAIAVPAYIRAPRPGRTVLYDGGITSQVGIGLKGARAKRATGRAHQAGLVRVPVRSRCVRSRRA